MKGSVSLSRVLGQTFRGAVAILCVALIALGDPGLLAGLAQQGSPPEEAPKIPNDQLDSLVAPIALYPDPLLAQVLAASTYPLEIIQLQQFLSKNPNLKGQALTDAVTKQPWDPTVQSLAALPDVVKRLADDIQWTTDLGNAFLSQQSDVMDAVQRMRKKALDNGALKSSDKIQVETKVVETKTVIVIQPADPQVVYVPVYTPTVVYGAPVYPYPPIYYPPPSYYAPGVFFSFAVGVAVGAAWGGWCCGASWGGNNNITINNNNTFVKNSNRQNINTGNRTGGGGNWQHNPQHRGGTPYPDRTTANRHGGTARGEPRQGQGQRGGGPQPSVSNRPSGGASPGLQTKPGGGQASPAPANRSGGGGADRVGGRDVSRNSGGGSALGGDSRGYNGSDAGKSSRRGNSSMGSAGGGGSRGGGGGGGGGGAKPRR